MKSRTPLTFPSPQTGSTSTRTQPRLVQLAVLFLVALWALWFAPSAGQAQEKQDNKEIWAGIVYASMESGPTDSRLAPYNTLFSDIFNYKKYEITRATWLQGNHLNTLPVAHSYSLRLQRLSSTAEDAAVQISVINQGEEVVTSRAKLSAEGGPVLVRLGRTAQGNELALLLHYRANSAGSSAADIAPSTGWQDGRELQLRSFSPAPASAATTNAASADKKPTSGQ